MSKYAQIMQSFTKFMSTSSDFVYKTCIKHDYIKNLMPFMAWYYLNG